MGHFGFSYVGLIYLLMLMIPNMIWTKFRPQGYSNEDENKVLTIFEKVGQILVVTTSVIFCDYNLGDYSPWCIWLVVSFAFMLLYEIWWVRYFAGQKRLCDFYSSILGIPVAGATLPIIAFLLLGIYGRVIWLIVSVIILGIGHIGIHLEHKSKIK